jgi:two-component system, cell cycle response regulator
MTEAILPSKVLFVDDDRSMRIAFANAARALGVEAHVAESGGQAIELARQGAFPVVVTDLNMPGLDGIALVERLSAMDPGTAFVLVSADPEPQSRMPVGAAGAIAAFLGKPLEMLDLQETLARAFTLHQRRQARAGISAAPKGWSVLVVEDSPGDADLLHDYLGDVPGLELVHATRLQEALRILHDREFDSIITDLTLPDARGFDAVLRLQAGAPNAAILVYSGVDDEALALQVVQLGAQDFLPKGRTDRETLLRSLRFARERKRSDLRLRRLAHYDPLTGLANRSSFADAATQAVARAGRRKQMLAVMMIDLDGFKQINDTLGHEAGDQILQEVGVRMRCVFREYDVVARFGGDEFAVMVTDVESLESLSVMVQRLLASLAQPIGNHESRVTASVGIALFPSAGRSPLRLLRSADMAMYKAKRNGRNCSVFFDGPVPVSTNPTFSVNDGLPPAGSAELQAPRLPDDLTNDGEAGASGVQKVAGVVRQRLA